MAASRSYLVEEKSQGKNSTEDTNFSSWGPSGLFEEESNDYNPNGWKRRGISSDTGEVQQETNIKNKTAVKLPGNFPGMSMSWREKTSQEVCEKKKMIHHEEALMNITMDDIQRVLSPRQKSPRKGNPGKRSIPGIEHNAGADKVEKTGGDVTFCDSHVTGNLSHLGNPYHGTRENINQEENSMVVQNSHGNEPGGVSKGVNTPRGKSSGINKYHVGDKLPSIESGKQELCQSLPNSPRLGSAHFNVTRLMTELDNLCRMKGNGDATGQPPETDSNLTLEMVHEARRSSVFSPRRDTTRGHHHSRHRSLPNLTLPQRYFVKLDPVRASASPVNLNTRNSASSRRCRRLSENLQKLDESETVVSEAERKNLIKQWVRETTEIRTSYANDQDYRTGIES